MNCTGCPSYNRGKGSQACYTCPDQLNIKPASKPGPRIINMRAEEIEDIAELISKPMKDILSTLDPKHSTMLLQSIILGMTHKEIAEYHLFSATKTVQRKINTALELIKYSKTESIPK